MRIGVPARARAAGRLVFALSLALFAATLAGCARADSVADRQIAEMREAIGEIQADRDRQRLDVEPAAARAPRPAKATPPPPRSVQIGSAADDVEPADPNDSGARPEIRLYGGSASSRSVRGKSSRSEIRVDEADDGEAAWKAPRGPDTGDTPLTSKESR